MSEGEPKRDEVLSAGALIGDHEIVELIGRGGFGEVYLALQLRLRREVAIKVVSSTWAKSVPDLPQRFTREIDLASRLEHPNIFRIYDCGETEDGVLWMAMEFIRGVTLAEHLSREIQLDFARSRHITLQILSGLMAAHEQLIIHRDLKPGNIMLTRQGIDEFFVKILDFGIGKALGDAENKAIQNLTQHGQAGQGTPRYMAPEQIRSEDLGPWTDLYAVGLILYEMLMGRPAVEGGSLYQVLANQMSQPIRLPAGLALSPLGAVLERALNKNPRERYQSAKEFFEELYAITQDPNDVSMLSQVSPVVSSSQLNTLRPLMSGSGPSAAWPVLTGVNENHAGSAVVGPAPHSGASMASSTGALPGGGRSPSLASGQLTAGTFSAESSAPHSQPVWPSSSAKQAKRRSALIVAIMAMVVMLLGAAVLLIIDWRSRSKSSASQELPKEPPLELAAQVEQHDSSGAEVLELAAHAQADELDWSRPLAPPVVDPELMDALMQMAAGCERVDAGACSVSSCKGFDASFDALVKNKTAVASLETMCAALQSDDERLVTVAAERLGSRFAQLDYSATRLDANGAELARRLIESVGRLGGCRANNVVRVATGVAYLAGAGSKLEQVLEQHPSKLIKQSAYPWLMFHPRMKGFERVRAVVGSSAPSAERSAAFDALFKMPEPSLQEFESLCPWGQDFLDDEQPAITAKAAALMIRCKSLYIDKLLAVAKEKRAAGRFEAPFSESLREICFRSSHTATPAGSPAQCSELFVFLESLVEDERLSPELRANALWNIYYQKRDQQALDLMLRYVSHSQREIRVKAREAAKTLVNHYGLRGELPAEPAERLAVELDVCSADVSWTGGDGPLLELAYASDKLYVLSSDGKLRRFGLQSSATACALVQDKRFGQDGVLETSPQLRSVSAHGEQLLLSTSYSSGWLRNAKGELVACSEKLSYRFAPDGKVFGFRGDKLKLLTFDEQGCAASMWSSAIQSIDAIGFSGEHVLLGGLLRGPAPGEAERVVLALDGKGIERFRFGTKYKTEDGFALIRALEPCPIGIAVLDGAFKALTLWSSQGEFVARVNTWDLPAAEMPATPSFVFVGDEAFVAANLGDLSSPKLEGRILRIRGLTLP